MTQEMVSVIIVNYNGQEVLEKCVQSVFQSSYLPLEVIIVDNSSHDGSADKILQTYNVKLIRNQRNLGFAQGNNQGLKEAEGEYILLLNNDATLHPKAIERLVNESKDSQSPIVQPKILMADNHNLINSTGISIHLAGFPVLMGCGEKDDKYTFSTNICAPHGACFLASKTVLNEIGLFDEAFVAFNEDTDLGWRALLMNKNIKFVPSAIVYHKWGHTYNQSQVSNKIYLAERNRLLMILTNYQRRTLILFLPIFILAECSTMVYCAFQGMLESKIKGYVDLMKLKPYLVKRRRRIQTFRTLNDGIIVRSFTLEYKHTLLGRSNKPLNMLFNILGIFLKRFLN